jgi:predicted ABC-type ATPase
MVQVKLTYLRNLSVKDKTFIDHFSIRSGVLHIGTTVKINSYHASFVASFLAEELLKTKQSFAFETVMSHGSKIALIQAAREAGYKTYLYFIFTDSIETNIARVKLRVLRGEHPVSEEIIKSRAPRTFDLLPKAFKEADSAYVIDNSDETKAVLKKEGHSLYKASTVPSIMKVPVQKILRAFKGSVLELKSNAS